MTLLTNKQRIQGFAIAALMASVMCSSASMAESAETVHLGKSDVSKEQVIELLAPKTSMAPKTRGLRLHAEQPAADSSASVARALSLEIYFPFDSANLTEDAMKQLSPVGEALQSNELENVAFTLEGHTDASGDESYNLHLSERRAKSVKDYFVENYALSPSRVEAMGKGESQIIDGTNPTSGVNRRVTIIAR